MLFAVLHHLDSPDGDHYDLLIEREPGSDLETWRLPAWPVFGVVDAKKLRDHRRAYLTYQGQISAGRGSVIRVAEGTATTERTGPILRVTFPHLGHALELHPQDEETWTARGIT